MDTSALESIAKKLVAQGKGILAADESTKSIVKKFTKIGIESSPETNRKYRELLVTTPEIENYLSGVIFFDETVNQEVNGKKFPDFVGSRGILPGIKVDAGLEPFNDTEEQVTKGLDGLAERLKNYTSQGLKFTKWRGVFKISDLYPSDAFYDENLERMATFAKLSQENGLVPIVEPEVLLEGNHTTTRSSEVIDETLKRLFEALKRKEVFLPGLILKTSMALPGPDSGVRALPLEVANATLRAIKRSVPDEVSGVVFLSGGQSADETTNNLNEIEKLKGDAPWEISFSFLRALSGEALEKWAGKDENVVAAQEVFLKRVKMVASARKGEL